MTATRPRAMLIGTLSLLFAQTAAAPAAEPAPEAAPAAVHRIKVLPDKAPDCSSLKSIVGGVTRDCKTNDEKAIAIYNFMQLTHYHQGYPGEKAASAFSRKSTVYGWSLCGGLHTVEAALWRELGWTWRFVGWSNPGHTTVEAEYDGRWHYLDVFLKFYAWMPDPNAPAGRTIAGQDDIKADPTLVTDGLVFDKDRGVVLPTRAISFRDNRRARRTGGRRRSCLRRRARRASPTREAKTGPAARTAGLGHRPRHGRAIRPT